MISRETHPLLCRLGASTALWKTWRGRFVIGLLGLLATLEVDVLGERTKQGVHVESELLGFKRAENRGLVQDEDETKIVERIRQLRKKKLPLREIAKIMNEEGHPIQAKPQTFPSIRSFRTSRISRRRYSGT